MLAGPESTDSIGRFELPPLDVSGASGAPPPDVSIDPFTRIERRSAMFCASINISRRSRGSQTSGNDEPMPDTVRRTRPLPASESEHWDSTGVVPESGTRNSGWSCPMRFRRAADSRIAYSNFLPMLIDFPLLTRNDGLPLALV